MATPGQNPQTQQGPTNAQLRQIVIANSVDAWQIIYQTTFTTGPGTVLNIPVRNVGLLKKFVVEIQANVQSPASTVTQTLQSFGPSNLLSNVTFTDLSNQVRINTSGWHLTMLASAKSPPGAIGAAATTDTPLGFGNNFTQVISAPATITTTTTANNVSMFYVVPIAYSDNDLRGGILASVVNATMNLQLTFNPNAFAASTVSDTTLAVYKSGGAAAVMPSCTVIVYQNYLDQLPLLKNGQGPLVPYGDLSVAYLLNNTAYSGIIANQDNPFSYANFRDFLSTIVVYDNNGTLNVGGDVSYFAIQSANYTNIIKADPNLVAFWTRELMFDDFPKGCYYFDHRRKPISTIQYGNMNLIMNPVTVNSAAASVLIGYESLALINMITNAGSISGT
jgi:hypothetical protein